MDTRCTPRTSRRWPSPRGSRRHRRSGQPKRLADRPRHIGQTMRDAPAIGGGGFSSVGGLAPPTTGPGPPPPAPPRAPPRAPPAAPPLAAPPAPPPPPP